MKRIFWGLVKIAIIVGLLVWAARALFPVEIENSEPTRTETETLEETSEREEEVIFEEKGKAIPSVVRSAEPRTEQQKKYALYSEKAGMPETFTTLLTFKGVEPLSAQLARALGEPQGDWENMAAHSKTFWVLTELTLQDINVDAAASLNGLSITVRNGTVLVDTSKISTLSFSVQTFISSVTPLQEVSMNTEEVYVPLTQKRMRRMSARNWQQVLETGTRGRVLEKR